MIYLISVVIVMLIVGLRRLSRIEDIIRNYGRKQGKEPVLKTPPVLPVEKANKEKEELRTGDEILKPAAFKIKIPALAPAETRQRSRFAESADEIIKKIWSWFLVGEEYRPKGVTIEYAVASTWLLRLGIVAIVACVGYFLKWSIAQNFINDAGRVGISIITGIGMLIFGRKILKGKYRLMGLGLIGGGLATLYFSVYAAVGMYSLIPVSLGFVLAVLVTVTAGFLAVRTDSMLLAILGIIGGYCSPLLLRTATPNLAVFYSYILLLGLGIIGITRYKPWRLLNYLSFIFAYSLFFVSLTHYQRADFPLALTFLSLFFVVQSSLVYMHNITHGNKSTALEVIHLLLNAGFYAATSYSLIINACGRPYPAIMSVALAGFYILHVMVFLKKKIVDRNLLIALIALACFCTTWTMPLIMKKETLTLSWSLQAMAFLWLGYKLNSSFIRHTAYIIYSIVFYRLLFLDIPANFGMSPVRGTQMSVYWRAMLERLWNFGVSIGSIVGGFFLQNRQAKVSGVSAIKKQNDIPQLINKNLSSNALYWFCALFVFLFIHLELNTMFAYFQPLRLPVLTILWCAMVAYFLYGFLKTGSSSKAMFAAMSIFLLAAVVKIFIIDLSSWKLCAKLFYDMEYSWFYAGLRLLDFGGVIVIVFMIWWFFSRTDAVRRAAVAFGSLGWLLLFVYTSLELKTFLYWRLPGFQSGGISILWALFAASSVVGGIWKNIPRLRYSGLCLFAVVAAKVFLLDLRDLAIIYRVIAFLIVGIFLLLGAFSYMYASGKFAKKKEE